ncbi:MAG TPA: glycosyltransferase [Chthoniobacterales bacterium]|jgi:glycosyltransferase involved in cell wall biosynthesis|nr:glycosyltransferase [Candidatus Udaeobacter sp.]HEV3392844.1 glycosyltransferase [Chthoniobacterales bacterium]
MLTLPTFSIVTPSFRQLDWLRLAIASVADQEEVTIEHIVQDAGTEGVNEFFQSNIAANRERHSVKLFVEKDAGMYDAVNRGLTKAHGDICAYLNCDEQLLPNVLARVAGFFHKHPEVEVVFGDSILIDKHGNPLSYRRTVLPLFSYVQHVQLNTPTCSTFFRRTVIDRGLLFDPQWKVIGDQVWIENLIRADVRMATLAEPLAVFTFTGQNLSSTAVSQEEGARHGRPQSMMTRLRRAAEIISHRMRKLAAGAYRFREVDIEIYTLDSPSVRQRRRAKRVGFGWPRAKAG